MKSTEFWAFVLMMIFLLANGTDHVNVDPNSVNIFIGALVAYIGGRSTVKYQQIKKNGGA